MLAILVQTSVERSGSSQMHSRGDETTIGLLDRVGQCGADAAQCVCLSLDSGKVGFDYGPSHDIQRLPFGARD